MKTTKKRTKSLLAMLLAILTLASLTQPAFAAEKTVNEEIKEHTGGSDTSAEYYAFTKMWSDYFLDFLPTDAEPEALKLLTNIPDYDGKTGWNSGKYPETGAWGGYFTGGYPTLMRDTVFNFAKELDLTNPNLSQYEKAKRISDFSTSLKCLNSILGDATLSVGGDKNPTWYGNCVTRADGIVALYRLAGIPACGVEMYLYGKYHTEAFCYVNGAWLHAEHIAETFTDYFGRMYSFFVTNVPTVFDEDGAAQHYYSPIEDLSIKIIDIDESWVGQDAERFMFKLLHKPFAYPDQKLTRGEVAKLLCNYLGVVPMRNEQIFSDVPVSHRYSPYVWAMNELQIMVGTGNGKFGVDTTLSMQEFAVIAMRVIEWGKHSIQETINSLIAERDSDNPDPYCDYEVTIKRYQDQMDNLFTPPAGSTPRIFADSSQIASWAKSGVDEFSKWGILQGDSTGADSRLNPTEQMSKTRFLVFMFKFNNKLKLFHEITPLRLF
ncbi:MAG: S-layer homology domain-containing protein [Oscillospiraceae bacterium]|jgi:hypothetical protein|nr:S-layer homology domain-containing protein [Oscillospiraceae bacterium]